MTMEVIRTTQLWSFWTCAYKSKNEPYSANPKNTYHWDLLNVWVTSTKWDFGPLLDYYVENINPDLWMKYNLAMLMDKAGKFINAEKEKDQSVFQETKLYLKRSEDVWIEWVPDVFTIHTPDEEGIEIDNFDLKCSTRSRYTWDEMRELNLQTYIYPLMLMNVYKKDKCRFSYVIWDKWNGKMKKVSKIRTKEECQEKVNLAMAMYEKANMLEVYPTRKNKLCSFCSLKGKCPEYWSQVTRVENDELF